MDPAEIARRTLGRVGHRLYSVPLVVLMPHSRCNARCLMCDIWKANADGRQLDVDDLLPLLGALERLHTRRVVLSGGEALLHPNLDLLAGLMRARGLRLTLLSTGLSLARHAASVAEWADEIVVSLDGSPRVHDAIRRVPRAFDRLAEGLAAVRAVAGRRVRLTARCTVQRANHDDLLPTVEAAASIGLDAISFLPVDVSSSAFNRLPVWGQDRVSETAPTLAEVERLERDVERLIREQPERFASGFVAESPERLRRVPAHLRAALGHGPFPAVRCNAPWVSTVIEADGTVRPCFFHAPIGNVHEAPLEAILDGEAAVAFRRGLDVTKDPTCTRCVCTLHIGARAEV